MDRTIILGHMQLLLLRRYHKAGRNIFLHMDEDLCRKKKTSFSFKKLVFLAIAEHLMSSTFSAAPPCSLLSLCSSQTIWVSVFFFIRVEQFSAHFKIRKGQLEVLGLYAGSQSCFLHLIARGTSTNSQDGDCNSAGEVSHVKRIMGLRKGAVRLLYLPSWLI